MRVRKHRKIQCNFFIHLHASQPLQYCKQVFHMLESKSLASRSKLTRCGVA